nr:histone lysine N methyltransferase MLL3 [Hymenolepis microstoma]
MSVDHRDALLWSQKDNCNKEDYSITARPFLDHSIAGADISCKAEPHMGSWSGLTPVKDSSPSSTEPTSMLSDKSSSRGTLEAKNSENTCFSTDTEHPASDGSLSPSPSQFPTSTSNVTPKANSVKCDNEISNSPHVVSSPQMVYKEHFTSPDSSVNNSAVSSRPTSHPDYYHDLSQNRIGFTPVSMVKTPYPRMQNGYTATCSDYHADGRKFSPRSHLPADVYLQQPRKPSSIYSSNDVFHHPVPMKYPNSYPSRPPHFWKANSRPGIPSTSPHHVDYLETRRRLEMQQQLQMYQINRRLPLSSTGREFLHQQVQDRLRHSSHPYFPDSYNFRSRGPSSDYALPQYLVSGRFPSTLGSNSCGSTRFVPPYSLPTDAQHYYLPFSVNSEGPKKRNSSPRGLKRKRSPSGSDSKFSPFKSNAETAQDTLLLNRLLSINASQFVSWPALENPIDINPPEPALKRKVPCHDVSSNPDLTITSKQARKYSSLPFILRSPANPTPKDLLSYLRSEKKIELDLRHNLLSEALSDAISRSYDSQLYTVPPSPLVRSNSPDPLNLFSSMKECENSTESPAPVASSSDIFLPPPKRRRISRSVLESLQIPDEEEKHERNIIPSYCAHSKQYPEERLTMERIRSAVTFVQVCQHCKMQILFATSPTSKSEETFCSETCVRNYQLQSPPRVLHKPTNQSTHPSAIGVPVMLQSYPPKLCKNKPQQGSSVLKTASKCIGREAFISTPVRKWKGSRWSVFSSLARMARASISNSTESSKSDMELKGISTAFELLHKGALPKCVLCKCDSDSAKNPIVGRLLNYACDKWIHANCILWCYGVSETVNGCFMNAAKALDQAKDQVCKGCSLPGAGLPCFAAECADYFHIYCAYSGGCSFYGDKSMYCPKHKGQAPAGPLLNGFEVDRKVYLERDEYALVEQVITSQCLTTSADRLILRSGTLVLNSLGQLLPDHVDSGRFHTPDYIYPVGFSTTRIYWSFRRPRHRCHYLCTIADSSQQRHSSNDGDNSEFLDEPPSVHPSPIFSITVKERGYPDTCFKASNCNTVWQHILRIVSDSRKRLIPHVRKVNPETMSGELLFGLNESHIVRAIESLPGAEHLPAHTFKFGKMELISRMPVMINPTGCARAEPKRRNYLRTREQEQNQSPVHGRIPRQNAAFPLSVTRSLRSLNQIPRYCSPPITADEPGSNSSQSAIPAAVASASSKYRALQTEWQYNVNLARSKIQGLGLFAARDIERGEFIIEYLGQLIRNEVGNKRERLYESQGRGIYMFRADDEWIVDATMYGGLARYINHSCDPNCVAEVIPYENQKHIVIIANRLLKKGEELTYDYKLDIEADKNDRIPCLCGSQFCRQWMN